MTTEGMNATAVGSSRTRSTLVGFGTPIYCKKCYDLALANLDESPLCENCLLEVLNKSEQPVRTIVKTITPLNVLAQYSSAVLQKKTTRGRYR